MIILAVDTSAKVSSAAVADEDHILAEFSIHTALTHSQTLMPMIDHLLHTASLTISDIDGFAAACGPGSFTGLRIGIGAVKGMAFGTQKSCAGISTLEGLAFNLLGMEGILCTAMDARCGQVYTALFEGFPGHIQRLTDDMAISIDELAENLLKYQKNIFFVGDGANLCYNKLSKQLPNCFLAAENNRFQRAGSVALAARSVFESGQAVSAAELSPAYLRLPQAERELKKKLADTKTL